jgi:hypothetical protein
MRISCKRGCLCPHNLTFHSVRWEQRARTEADTPGSLSMTQEEGPIAKKTTRVRRSFTPQFKKDAIARVRESAHGKESRRDSISARRSGMRTGA